MSNKPSTNKQLESAETAVVLAESTTELTSNAETAMNMAEMEADAGAGSTDVGVRDIALPFYKILASNCKECTEGEPKFIDGARGGMILNNVTGQLIPSKTGVVVLRAAYEKEFVEWAPVRGGGPKGRHAVESAAVRTAKRSTVPDGQGGQKEVMMLPNGNILVETAYHYVVVLNEDGSVEWATIPMSSTQLKYSGRWNSMIQKHTIKNAEGKDFTPAHYQQMYLLRTMPDKNAKGNFYSWDITKAGDVKDMRFYNSAKEYRKAVLDGLLKSAIGADEPAAGGSGVLKEGDDGPF